MITSTPAGPVTTDDVDLAVDALIDALTAVLPQDWHVPANDSDWDCWEVVEHICDDLFVYGGQLAPKRPPLDTHVPFAYQALRVGGPPGTIFADPRAGQAGLIQVLDASRTFLTAIVRTTSPDARAHHIFGLSDPEGFAAMGVVEVLAHGHDVALGLGVPWAPPTDLCERVLRRLFPNPPEGSEPWATLLWATGRGTLPGRERLTSWQWDGRPRD